MSTVMTLFPNKYTSYDSRASIAHILQQNSVFPDVAPGSTYNGDLTHLHTDVFTVN